MAVNLESCDSLPPDLEPKLKYDRLENDVQSILLKDAVSCICVHTKFICLGTQWGVIHLLDHEGNTVPISQDGKYKELKAHTVAVNRISVDLNGDYIASCSDDGKVMVYGLYTSENTHELTLNSFVKSIALDPYYFKSGSGRRFLTVDLQVSKLLDKWYFTPVCQSDIIFSATSGTVGSDITFLTLNTISLYSPLFPSKQDLFYVWQSVHLLSKVR